MTEPANYKDTLNLPKTAFDMKANLLQREPAMLKAWQELDAGKGLYQKIQETRKKEGGKKWVLHDGPPYANGDIHMGHLINKVLKDIVVKFRTMQGHLSPYVPGWDCHGLPIESAIQKELGPKMRELTKEQIRQKCHDYAMKFVKLQSEGFKRLGILADYEHPYLTLDPKYESGIMDVLAELVQRDLVYRQKKPVHWCTFDRTALAEAELEYADRKDHSIYVNFRYEWKDLPMAFWDFLGNQAKKNAKTIAPATLIMIWTTTPWTLPANRAVAIHPDAEYVMVQYDFGEDQKATILAKNLVEKVMAAAGIARFEISAPVTGKEWVKTNPRYNHPLDATRLQPVVLANYVTLEDGTGLVHTAPGHGTEDYQTGKRENLEIYNPVLPDGKYDDTVPEFLRGKSIWDANQLVIDKLKDDYAPITWNADGSVSGAVLVGGLFHHQEFNHSYPHCWRCRKPVIFRATEQWFVKASSGELSPAQLTAALAEPTFGKDNAYDETMEKSSLWRNGVKFTYLTQFIPTWGRNRLQGMLATRPDWCISRQRSWGVPIPAFFDEKGNVLLTEKSVRHVANYFKQHGADSWYTHTPQQILGTDKWTDTAITPDGKTVLSFEFCVLSFTKGADILDVWFEAGASHHAVLEGTHPELGYPADMYLEGSDQHRGWFQSSLLESAGYKSEPPYRQVLTHGFVVDENGRKMSKSEGNDIKVADALKKYGADILRLWVASVDYQNDIPCGWSLFDKTGEAYRKIRNTIRYLLGNLYDFNPHENTVTLAPHSIDRWMQARLDTWAADVFVAFDTYEFHKAFKLIYEFCNVEISSVFAKAIKDRLYCELPNSPKRRASQTVCYNALLKLIELTAPILAFTAEESWAALRQLPGSASLTESVHLHTITLSTPTQDAALSTKHWSVLLPLIESGNKQLDELKRTIGLGNPLDAEAVIILPTVADDLTRNIAQYGPEIEDALGVGFHRTEHGEIWDIKINDTREKYPSCARSWKRRPDVGTDKDYPDLSARDATVVRTLRNNQK